MDGGPYDGKTALAAGLVDELLYADQLRDRLKDAESVSPGRYAKAASSSGFGFDRRPRIAVVYAVGEIVGGESQGGAFGGQVAGSDTVAAALQAGARGRQHPRHRVARGQPGRLRCRLRRHLARGQAGEGQEAARRLDGRPGRVGRVLHRDGGDSIVAQPGTITGSIGVFGGKFTLRGLYDKLGITKEILVRGRHADLFSEYEPWDEAERAKFRGLMVSFYEEFVKKAAEGRKMSYEDVDAIAQGRVWTGAEALEHGLVDKLGGMDVAIAVAKERAKIDADDEVALVLVPERKGLIETILERQEEEVGESTMLPRDLRAFLRWARHLGDGQIAARLPFDLQVR